MATHPQTDSGHHLVEHLYRTREKAEIAGGELRVMSPSGDLHNRAALKVVISLVTVEKEVGGRAFTDNAGFLVELPNRQSFSPDAAFYYGEPAGLKFLPSAPAFAVEVRSSSDYGPAAERAMAERRADYFAAGTEVVWDVDLLGEDTVRVYRKTDPDPNHPTVYRRGEVAEAEPAVPGWQFPVDEMFDDE